MPARRGRLGKVRYTIARYRRAGQMSVLALLILAPFLNWFRFDLGSGSFHLFGERLWFRQFYLVGLLVTLGIFVIVAATVVLGRVFCGWVCPQNLFNELELAWERRIGRPAALVVSVLIALFGSFVVVSYFTPGGALLAGYFRGQTPVGPTLGLVSGTVFFSAVLGWVRTRVCTGICPYGYLQSLMTYPETMHLEVTQPPGVTDICRQCGLCYETCHMAVDPRELLSQRDCVACGDCLDACQLVSDARRLPRILNFTFGSGPAAVPIGLAGQPAGNLARWLRRRLLIPSAVTLLLLAALLVGMGRRPLLEVAVVRDHTAAAAGVGDSTNTFIVTLVNLTDQSQRFTLEQEGLPDAWVRMEPAVSLEPGEEARLLLQVYPVGAERRLYSFSVRAQGQGVSGEAGAGYFPGN